MAVAALGLVAGATGRARAGIVIGLRDLTRGNTGRSQGGRPRSAPFLISFDTARSAGVPGRPGPIEFQCPGLLNLHGPRPRFAKTASGHEILRFRIRSRHGATSLHPGPPTEGRARRRSSWRAIADLWRFRHSDSIAASPGSFFTSGFGGDRRLAGDDSRRSTTARKRRRRPRAGHLRHRRPRRADGPRLRLAAQAGRLTRQGLDAPVNANAPVMSRGVLVGSGAGGQIRITSPPGRTHAGPSPTAPWPAPSRTSTNREEDEIFVTRTRVPLA